MPSPTGPKPISNALHCYYKQGRMDLAVADCDIAIKLKPDYADAYRGRAAARWQSGDTALEPSKTTRDRSNSIPKAPKPS